MSRKIKSPPVLFIVFNRVEESRKVFESIRAVKPSRLYIAADGPRKDVADDKDKCVNTRKISELVDWNCELKTLYRDENLGCGMGPVSAINWFFEHEEAGIILEDDCLAEPDFFQFCYEMLDRYREDTRIGSINGENHLNKRELRNGASYYFSRVNHCWGWATWKRAWDKFDINIPGWSRVKEAGWLDDALGLNREGVKFWTKVLDDLSPDPARDIWDYQWNYTCLINNFLTIVPEVNTITNIGFNEGATHTTEDHKLGNKPSGSISFPLKHPDIILPDTLADNYVQHELFPYVSPLRQKFRTAVWKFKQLFKG